MADFQKTLNYVNNHWDETVIPTLTEYVKVPNQSPLFDAKWKENQTTQKAVVILTNWIKSQNVTGLKLEVHQDGERTPLLFMEVDATIPNNQKKLLCSMDILINSHR